MIDISSAKFKHLTWRFRLLKFLEGQEALTLDQVVSHKHCDLGKWIYSEGLAKYGHLQTMTDLEKVHESLHAAIKRVVELKEQNLIKESELAYDEMKNISDVIMELLDSMGEVQSKFGNANQTKIII